MVVRPLQLLALGLALSAGGCCCGLGGAGGVSGGDAGLDVVPAPAQEALSRAGFTPHFRSWLEAHGHDAGALARDDLDGGSYGGRAHAGEEVAREPVVFVHGNSDQALSRGAPFQTGWSASLAAFQARGHRPAELYATTWGPADTAQARQQQHTRANVGQVRALLEAVLAYTGAAKVDVVAHSMGVTLARKAIQGGTAVDAQGAYELGAPLTDRVDTFVGIAGANRGLTACYLAPFVPTCDGTTGFFPGHFAVLGVVGRSSFLEGLDARPGFEGTHRFSIYSTEDELLRFGGIVYGLATSAIPGQTGEKVYRDDERYGHIATKDLSTAVQYEMVVNHRVP